MSVILRIGLCQLRQINTLYSFHSRDPGKWLSSRLQSGLEVINVIVVIEEDQTDIESQRLLYVKTWKGINDLPEMTVLCLSISSEVTISGR